MMKSQESKEREGGMKPKGSGRKGRQWKENEGRKRAWQGRKGTRGGQEGDNFMFPVTPGPLPPHNSTKNFEKKEKRNRKKGNIEKGT